MVDGVLLLVDAREGPLPQTRFVLRKALEARLPVVLVVNKVDRPDARIAEVVDEVYELFLDLDADEEPDRVPDRLHEREGGLGVADGGRGGRPTSSRSWTSSSSTSPRPPTTRAIRCRRTSRTSTRRPTWAAWRSAASATGRSAAARTSPGAAPTAAIARAKIAELYITEALDRVSAEEAGPGEIIAVAGLPDVTIGETLADLEDPRPLPVIRVDEPSLSVTIGVNTSPLAGQDGGKLTARQIEARLEQELIGNVSLRVQDDRAARRVGGPGPRGAAARRARRAHAPRGLRADRRQAAGAHARHRRDAARAVRARLDRPARGLRRRRHAALRAAQGAHGADGQPRQRLGAHGAARPRPRPRRLPHRVPHRDARHRPAAPRLRRLGAVGRRAAHPPDRLARRRPARQDRVVRALRPAGARHAVRRPGRGGLRGDGRGGERPLGGPRRQRREGEAPHEHALVDVRRARAPRPAPAAVARPGDGVRARGRVRRGDAGGRCGCARSSWTRRGATSSRATGPRTGWRRRRR